MPFLPAGYTRRRIPQWFDARVAKPDAYELVKIEFADGAEQSGWWTGDEWDFGRRVSKCVVIRWQKIVVQVGVDG